MSVQDSFEVENPQIIAALRHMGRDLKGRMPEGWGFALLMFDYGTSEGSMFYLSSAERSDMLKAMKEFIAKQEKEP